MLILTISLLSGCGSNDTKNTAASDGSAESAAEKSHGEPELTQFSDLKGKTVSMLTGAPFEELVKSKEPGVAEFTFFNNNPDMMLALKEKKTDAVLSNNAIVTLAANRNPGLILFPKSLKDGVFGYAFAKGDPRLKQWQKAFDTIPEETKKSVWEKWTGADDSKKILPEQDWPGTNGTMRVAACDTLEPMSYAAEGGKIVGFDIELLLLTAKEMDCHLEITGMEFAAILSSVQAGKADIGTGSIIATDERRQSVDFLDYYPASFTLLVREVTVSEQGEEDQDFWAGLGENFERTFIREDRWKMFLEGIGTTLLITFFSILFGTLLGFLCFMLCRKGNRAANAIARFAVWLVLGMPVVVLLMILYYIIFAKTSLSGTAVSIIGFTLTFGAGVFGMIRTGVEAIDKGQMEAAYALGYRDRRAFFRIILPQTLPLVMPTYIRSVTELIKATAIVGYVAVQDLTKVGDLIRSRTYDAFFPLIAIAVIYFILAAVLTFIVKRTARLIEPRRRKKENILKGVEMK